MSLTQQATLGSRIFRVSSKKHDFSVEIFRDPLLLQRHLLRHVAGVGKHPEEMEKWLAPPNEKIRHSREIRNQLQKIHCAPAKEANSFIWGKSVHPCASCVYSGDCFKKMSPYLEAYLSSIELNVRICFENNPRHAHYCDYRPESFTCLSDNMVLIHAVAISRNVYNITSCYSLINKEGLSEEELFDIRQDIINNIREEIYSRQMFYDDPKFCTPSNWNVFV